LKLKSSTKIFIGFVVIVTAGYFGYKFITDSMILGKHFPEITPGDITLLGVDPGSGYSIIVANQAASLVKGGESELKSGEMNDTEHLDMRKKIPLRAMLDILEGDEKPLGRFIMSLNDVKQDGPNWPTIQVYWSTTDLQKALNGDPILQKKLETDLNVKLDGTPLEVVRVSALQNGIVVRLPIPIDVMVAGKKRKMTGYFLEPYRPNFSYKIDERLNNKNYTMDMLRGYYIAEAQNIASGKSIRENIADTIKKRLDPKHIQDYAKEPQQVLSKAKTILNGSLIKSAHYIKDDEQTSRTMYRLIMELTDEGRDRLWQYSKLNRGAQLLFIVNGTAIAAPRVKDELPQRSVTITSLQDEDLVKDAVDTINHHQKGKGDQ
jgi:hypothetical protein